MAIIQPIQICQNERKEDTMLTYEVIKIQMINYNINIEGSGLAHITKIIELGGDNILDLYDLLNSYGWIKSQCLNNENKDYLYFSMSAL